MVAYSFQKQFVGPILDGTKRQTIRADRKRHARPGEELQLYTGMRTRHCKLIAKRRCIDVGTISLDLDAGRIVVKVGESILHGHYPNELDGFARGDGFSSWDEMRAFWAKHHPGATQFQGIIITWAAL